MTNRRATKKRKQVEPEQAPDWPREGSVLSLMQGRVLSHAPGMEGRRGTVVADVPLDNVPADSVALVRFDDGETGQIHVRWLERLTTEREAELAAVPRDDGLIDAPLLHQASKLAGNVEAGAELGLTEDAIRTYLREATFTDRDTGEPLPLHGTSLSVGISIGLAATILRDDPDRAAGAEWTGNERQ